MTAPHVIERLKSTDCWFIVAKDDHEIALFMNALVDATQLSISYISRCVAKNVVIKYFGRPDFIEYGKLRFYVNREESLTDWFFKEVNNY